ncbi:MAG: class I SAM-dependent methyltransferase [Planctomycetes bacterium]|nr:class I SAM-dependent methyltransferase [Planctomycetota bacterium]
MKRIMEEELFSSVEQFYNAVSKDYNEFVHRAVPRYPEMLWAIFQYVPKDLKPKRILELGCGTGNLSELIVKTYPNAEKVLVDISEEAIGQCKNRLKDNDRIEYCQADISELDFPAEAFDLIVSSITIHHLKHHEKELLFKKAFTWLTSEGVFTYADQFAGETKEIYDNHMKLWHRFVLNSGCSEDEWELWMKHQDEHDYHATAIEQISWLKKANFNSIDITWRYLLWTVVIARKGI